MRNRWLCSRLLWMNMALISLALAGCGSSTVAASAPGTSSSSPTATATSIPSPTTPPLTPGTTTFTCPTTLNGSVKVFTDTVTGLSFSYPATWTEADCQRIVATNGTQTLLIGNLYYVGIAPRDGLTIQQWVNQQSSANETVTLTSLSVPHAESAVTVKVTTTTQNPGPQPPFTQTMAIVAGNHYFYVVEDLIAQMSMTDTMPHKSNAQLVQQIVTTFDVP